MGKGAAPGRHVVIVLRPAPAQPHGNCSNVAQLAAVQCRLHSADSLVVAVLENRKQIEAQFIGARIGVNELFGAHERRLFDDHMAAELLENLHGVFEMHPRWRDDSDGAS